jgi:hypothetical protein
LKSNHGSTELPYRVCIRAIRESVVYDFAIHDFACRPFLIIHHPPIPHPLSKLLSPKTLAQTSLSFCIFHSSFCIFFKPALDKN